MSTIPASQLPEPAGTFEALRHRNFRLLWISLLVSNSGTWLQAVAQDYVVYHLTGRALDLGWVNGARAVPLILFAFAGGTVADRVDRRRLLILTQSLFALAAIVLGVLVQTHTVQVWHVVLLSFFTAALLAVDQPARQSLIPQLVPRASLSNAIALNSITYTGAASVGPALAGPLVLAVGLPWAFYLNGLSYLAVIYSVWAISLPKNTNPRPPEPVGRALSQGVRYIAKSPDILLLVSLLMVFSLTALPYQSLLPVFAKRVFHGGVGTLGYLRAAPGVGALIGGFLAARYAHVKKRGWVAVLAGLALSLGLLIFCGVPWLPGALLALLLVGLCSTLFTSSVQALLQTLTSDAMRGRVMSLFTIAVLGMWPLGTLPWSALSDKIGPSRAAALGASLAGLFAIGVALIARRRIERLQLNGPISEAKQGDSMPAEISREESPSRVS